MELKPNGRMLRMTKSNEVVKVEVDESDLKSKRDPNFIPSKSLKAHGTLSVDKPLKGAGNDGQSRIDNLTLLSDRDLQHHIYDNDLVHH